MIEALLASACKLVTGATVEWHCDPNADVQRIYFGNHSSHLDFIAIWSALPPRLRRRTRPVAGRDYWEGSAVRRYLAADVFRAVLIDRGHSNPDQAVIAARASVEQMARAMGDRDSLIVFPEGTRSIDGVIRPFKSGLYHLARARPDVELIPVHLENLNRILPKGESLPVPMLSRVTFGTPLRCDASEQKNEFLTRSRAALLDLEAAA
jgi:1-acyl-sn-glycerol-3-phosphate acyltransferase